MSEENRQLRVGLPSGSLQEPTISLFAKAGFTIAVSSRSYKPSVDDPELVIRLLRAQEISRYVEHGFLDCGLTGKDWIENNGSDVTYETDFRSVYARVIDSWLGADSVAVLGADFKAAAPTFL